jgi:hypothetical protein
MYVKLGVFASVLLVSACTAAVGGDEERVVTANDVSTPGEAIWVDLSRPEAAVRLEGLKSVRELARVNVITGEMPPTTADDMVRVASLALGREVPRDHLSLRANLGGLTSYRPKPDCAGAPTVTGCCPCGIVGHPCLGFVCIEPELE